MRDAMLKLLMKEGCTGFMVAVKWTLKHWLDNGDLNPTQKKIIKKAIRAVDGWDD